MHYFQYNKNRLYCENKELIELAEKYGTPLYVYSARTMREHLTKIKKAFRSINLLVCYSVKANSNLAILKLLTSAGAGLDIVSGGELYRAKKVKCAPKKIVYASVGKTDKEIKEAIRFGILMFNVESLPELQRIDETAARLKKKVKVALRLNPDVEAHTHAYITTGKKENKFGIDIVSGRDIFMRRAQYPNLDLCGIHIHIGSQITKAAPFVRAIKRVNKLISWLRIRGVGLKYLNIGGGLGIVYDKERPQKASDFARCVVPLLKESGLKIILEPGRFIVGNAGAFIVRVVYVKDALARRFVVVDGAMNDLLRPSLYGAYHAIVPFINSVRRSKKPVDIVGPVCESGDFLGKGRDLDVVPGEYLAVLGAGAYGFSMSSNYNSRPRAAEVLVDKGKARIIRRREGYADLVRGEKP